MDNIDQQIIDQIAEIRNEINNLEQRYDDSFDEIVRVVKEEIGKMKVS